MTARASSLVHPKYKTKYSVGNWREYEQGLRARGDVMIWFSEDAIAAWIPRGKRKRGAQRLYSDLAIETALTLGIVFHLPSCRAQHSAQIATSSRHSTRDPTTPK